MTRAQHNDMCRFVEPLSLAFFTRTSRHHHYIVFFLFLQQVFDISDCLPMKRIRVGSDNEHVRSTCSAELKERPRDPAASPRSTATRVYTRRLLLSSSSSLLLLLSLVNGAFSEIMNGLLQYARAPPLYAHVCRIYIPYVPNENKIL